ncbi:hypothetical protein HMI54_002857, partial [Coelomomyces lativittatus]
MDHFLTSTPTVSSSFSFPSLANQPTTTSIPPTQFMVQLTSNWTSSYDIHGDDPYLFERPSLDHYYTSQPLLPPFPEDLNHYPTPLSKRTMEESLPIQNSSLITSSVPSSSSFSDTTYPLSASFYSNALQHPTLSNVVSETTTPSPTPSPSPATLTTKPSLTLLPENSISMDRRPSSFCFSTQVPSPPTTVSTTHSSLNPLSNHPSRSLLSSLPSSNTPELFSSSSSSLLHASDSLTSPFLVENSIPHYHSQMPLPPFPHATLSHLIDQNEWGLKLKSTIQLYLRYRKEEVENETGTAKTRRSDFNRVLFLKMLGISKIHYHKAQSLEVLDLITYMRNCEHELKAIRKQSSFKPRPFPSLRSNVLKKRKKNESQDSSTAPSPPSSKRSIQPVSPVKDSSFTTLTATVVGTHASSTASTTSFHPRSSTTTFPHEADEKIKQKSSISHPSSFLTPASASASVTTTTPTPLLTSAKVSPTLNTTTSPRLHSSPTLSTTATHLLPSPTPFSSSSSSSFSCNCYIGLPNFHLPSPSFSPSQRTPSTTSKTDPLLNPSTSDVVPSYPISSLPSTPSPLCCSLFTSPTSSSSSSSSSPSPSPSPSPSSPKTPSRLVPDLLTRNTYASLFPSACSFQGRLLWGLSHVTLSDGRRKSYFSSPTYVMTVDGQEWHVEKKVHRPQGQVHVYVPIGVHFMAPVSVDVFFEFEVHDTIRLPVQWFF